MKSTFSILFGGEAGYGTMSAGSIIAKAAVRKGFWAHSINEFPSLIKGGLNTSLVVISDEKSTSANHAVRFLGVLSQPALDIHLQRLEEKGILLYDSGAVHLSADQLSPHILAVGIDINKELPTGAPKVMSNALLLGAFAALTGFPSEWLRETLLNQFQSNPEIAALNGKLFDQAFQKLKEKNQKLWKAESPAKADERLLMNGNDAIALGALAAGVRFASGYPMTPGTSVLSFLSDHGSRCQLVFKQSEDELAAMNMLIGASFSGARALGSTSGGGFALMTEALGFAAQAELPITMVVAQRGGPSTGLPTRTMQADLQVALYSGAGEFFRLVVAPGDIEQCFYETFRTVNLADRFQIPAIILTDKELSDSTSTIMPFNTSSLSNGRPSVDFSPSPPYLRYRDTDDGISPRTFPGTVGGEHIATSYTHQEDGFYSSGNKEYAEFEPEVTRKSIDKMHRKFQKLQKELEEIGAVLHGPENADLTIIGWGGSKGAISEAMEIAKENNYSINYLQILYASPFPKEKVLKILNQAKRTLLIEGNSTAQMGQLIRQETSFALTDQYLKYDSLPFTPEEIWKKIQEVLA